MKKLFTLVSMLMMFGLANASVQQWGQLKLVDRQLCSQDGKAIQLRGWSTHGSWYSYCFDDKEDFQKQKNEGANMARIASYMDEGMTPDQNWVKKCIDITADLDMYCLVDWHVLRNYDGNGSKGNPMDKVNDAKTFFQNISDYVKGKGYKHVLYEICNEPNYNIEGDPYELGRDYVWDWIKQYSAQILPVIKANDPNAIVMVGTPQWDQAVVFPFMDPIDECGMQVMYSFHHYAGNQERYLGLMSSAAAFIPIFVTEWGLSQASGAGEISTSVADKMIAICNGKNLGGQIISWANWSWADKGESSGTFVGGTYQNNPQYTEAGKYIVSQLKKGDNFSFCESTVYDEPQEVGGASDTYIALEKFDKGGNNNAYYDFDEDWVECKPVPCNSGHAGMMGVRGDDYVDIGYTDEDNLDNSYFSLGYIGQGEWVKYTINVKHAGDYDFETFTTNHIDYNVIAFAVDGENALVDTDGNEIYRALELQPCNGGVESGGYNDWGWTTPISPYAKDKKFRLRFKEAGEHKLAIAFMSSASGLGSLKIKGNPAYGDGTSVENVPQAVVKVWPNPSADGSVNVLVDTDSQVSVFNAQGIEVLSAEVSANVASNLNASLSAGVYYVTVKSDKGVSTEKLIVK